MESEKIKQETLEFVNKVRESLALESLVDLEHGRMGDSSFCPVATSIRKGWLVFHSITITDKKVLITFYGNDPVQKELRDAAARKLTDLGEYYQLDPLVQSTSWGPMLRIHLLPTSPVSRFVFAFDAGDIPELIER